MALLGAPYPITPSPLGLLRSVEEEATIKGDLLQLILTNPGERVMLPQYGTPLRKYLFEQNILLLTKINSSLENNNLNTYKIFNDLSDFKKLVFIVAVIEQILNKK